MSVRVFSGTVFLLNGLLRVCFQGALPRCALQRVSSLGLARPRLPVELLGETKVSGFLLDSPSGYWLT